MAPIVYATVPATLQAAIDIAKRYEAGFIMTQPKTNNYIETEVTGQLEALTVTVQQLLRKKKEEAYLAKIVKAIIIASDAKNQDTS